MRERGQEVTEGDRSEGLTYLNVVTFVPQDVLTVRQAVAALGRGLEE